MSVSKLSELIYEGDIFKIEAYKTDKYETPALEWLEASPERLQVKFAALFKRLADNGRIYNEQKFKHLTGTEKIFEFKADDARVLSFFFFGKRVILTHGFIKKSKKTPKREIERPQKIKKEFEQRMKK